MLNSKKKEYSLCKVFSHIIKDIICVIPLEVFLHTCVNLLHAVFTVLIVVFTQRFFDAASEISQKGDMKEIVIPLVLFVMSYIMMEIFNGLSNYPVEFLSPKYMEHMHVKLHEKCSKVNAIHYENAEFLDQINKAKDGMESGFMAGILVLMVFTFYVPYYLCMGFYLKNLSPLLSVIILLVFVPVIAGKIIRFRIFAHVEDRVAPMRRKMDYYEQTICEKDYFKETRMLGAFSYFIHLFSEMRKSVNDEMMKAEKKHARIEFLLRLSTIIGYLMILIILVRELIDGKISVGSFAAVFEGVGTMYSLAEEIFGGVLQFVTKNAAAIYNFQKLMDFPERDSSVARENTNSQERGNGIYLKDVHFQYPNAGEEAIKGITLHIPEKKTIAVVGENGSGKSTLVKLIMGMYPTKQGSICVQGRTVADSEYSDIAEKCSAVFQDFQKYRLSLKENIIIGDINADVSKEDFFNVCKSAEISIDREIYPQGEETILSKEFGGTDLSGGQWQRIAIARGLYKKHDIIVLDEPTSAIDPVEESLVYQKFAEMSKEKTSIIVTHRVGAAQLADFILVMKKGKIIESGEHSILLEQNGVYAKMFHEQAKWYIKG